MPLAKRDREFRLAKVSYLDFKQIEMDRVLTAFFARLAHKGYASRLRKVADNTLQDFVAEFLEHPEWFAGFRDHPDVAARWIETHLLDVVNRGKPDQAVAAPRPLHGFTYRFRNPRHSRDNGAAQHLYELTWHARHGAGARALEHLENFFFLGYDRVTGRDDGSATLDVEKQALLRLTGQVEDAPDTKLGRESFAPLCVGAADLIADDVQRLLFYQPFIPRSVMVDYLKVLLAFHLGLYHLRLFKLLPALVRRRGGDPVCAPTACPMNPRRFEDPQGDCPYRVGLFVDVVARPEGPVAGLAERSADTHYRRVTGFVRASFAARKLDEFAAVLVRQGRLLRPESGEFTVGEVLALLGAEWEVERDKFFGQRVKSLEDLAARDDELDPEVRAVAEMALPEFDAYVEALVALRGGFHRHYITQCVDSLLLKNRPGALVARGRTRHAPRRFVLDSRLLEVLLQLAVLRPGGAHGYHTAELRIDELLLFLRERYGLHIDQLPRGDGFEAASIDDRKALRDNRVAFVTRLREVGFYRDLSDAYVTQTITPRYRIAESRDETPGGEP